MMQKFYKERLARHQTKMMRYLKYVFNDHIALISIFLLGGFGFYYSTFVKSLDETFILGKVVVAVIWFLLLFIGRMATLAKEADKVFLLPKENQMMDYLRASFKHSLALPVGILLLGSSVAMPLLIAVNRSSVLDFGLYFLMLCLLKVGHLFSQEQELFLANEKNKKQAFIVWLLSSIIAIFMSLFIQSWMGLLVAAGVSIFEYTLLKQTYGNKNLDWEKLIDLENSRMKQIYQFINLFTDVPGISGKVKRRSGLDFILNRIKPVHSNTYLYLYERSFLRGSEYSGLVFRLLLVGGTIVVFLNEFYLTLAVALITVYLIGFQLIPIYSQFDYMIMTELYPVPKEQKKKAVNQLLTKILIFVGIVLSFLVLIFGSTIKESGIIIAAMGIEILLFVKLYVNNRLKKMDRF